MDCTVLIANQTVSEENPTAQREMGRLAERDKAPETARVESVEMRLSSRLDYFRRYQKKGANITGLDGISDGDGRRDL